MEWKYMRGMGIALVAALALGLAGCGGGGGSGPTADSTPEPTPQEMCEADGGRWNADDTCSTAMDLAEEEKKRVAARNAVVKTKAAAIETERAQAADAGLGGAGGTPTDRQVDGEYNLDIERDGDGTTITVTVEGATSGDNEMFVKAADLTHTVEGHAGQMLTYPEKMDPDAMGNVVQEIAVVYTDIEKPKVTPFGDVEMLETDGHLVLDSRLTDLQDVGGPFAHPGPATAVPYPGDDATTTDVDEAYEFVGFFRGAPGTYRCNLAAGCSATFIADAETGGNLSAVSAGWIFTPDEGATIALPDVDYFHYGFWLKKTDKDGVVTYNEVQTFAGGPSDNLVDSGDINDVVGKATYTGGAAGVYVKDDAFDPDTGKALRKSAGRFTADAELTAYFGSPAEPDDFRSSLEHTLTGMIDNFHLDGVLHEGWEVKLEADHDASTNIASNVDNLGGTALGGGAPGRFEATFYRESTVETDQPNAIVGEFNANFNNGAVAGAFGARIVEDE